MSLKVQIISKETIKPSSPTSPHLRTFNICFFDQIGPPIYIPILLFYANKSPKYIDSLEACRRLKTSLSETLTSFYPIAGRINGNTSVDCNDEGVDYVEARVNIPLSEVVMHPNVIEVLKLLLPGDEPHFDELSGTGSKVLLAIQVNLFDCGGIGISVCLSHKISDAYAMATFINCWASKARTTNEVTRPISELSSLFPQRGLLGYNPSAFIHSGKGHLVTKRFVFDASKIASLRAEVENGSCVTYPTRVEAVSALLWRRFMESTRWKNEHARECIAIHAVNFRRRMVPAPFHVGGLEETLGNICGSTFTSGQEVESKIDLHVLVGKLRDAIRNVDCEFVRRMQYGDEYMQYLMGGLKGVVAGEMGLVIFTSWCSFPWYETDFGWGKPIWVTTSCFPGKNIVVLMDTESGDGIEASVNMLEEDMALFEQDEEFISFLSSSRGV